MGLDLTVLPNRYYLFEGLNDGYNRLALERDYSLFEAIDQLSSQLLSQSISRYGDDGIEQTQVDDYGNQLRWIAASEFSNISVADITPWNRAILSFLRNLPPDMPVILYWH